ncbi:hypothetical protein Thiosp_00084 [Thiorhodovibrio litoralis]|nr:hypothetical protein Thiosp_00084 [Thiorhodovibrio litoralis]
MIGTQPEGGYRPLCVASNYVKFGEIFYPAIAPLLALRRGVRHENFT